MNKVFVLLALSVLILAAAGTFYLYSKPAMSTDTTTVAEETTKTETEENLPAIDVEAALSERIIGDPSAPIRISEHASLTCGHCSDFHKNNFKLIKAALIDTGKAYFVFSDFPLNAPALHASMLARCLPHDQYFNFIDMLFEKQDEWAFSPDYIKFLQASANEIGLDTLTVKSCLSDKKLQDGIVGRMTASRTQWYIESTPSFVVNNKTIITGAVTAEEFIKQVNEAATASSPDTP